MPKTEYKEDLLTKLNGRSATIAVVGLGYVGLPLACAFAEAGHGVIGIDLSIDRVEGIMAGNSHITDVPPSQVKRLVDEKRLRATTEFEAARKADVAVIAVPTPIDEYRVPDLSYVTSAANSLAEVMPKGSLVVLESTTYPGTTDEVVVPAFRQRGYMPGVDVFIAY